MSVVCQAAVVMCVVPIAISGFGAARFDVTTFLKNYARFTSEDLARISRGRVVVKGLEADDSEVAFCGAVRLAVPPAFYVERFRDIESFKRAKNVLQIGRFGAAPTAADMRGLQIDDDNLKDLRRCTPGDCDVRLDASGIRRLTAEAMNAANVNMRLAAATREHLAAYAAAYLQRGNSVLMEYHDSEDPKRVATELEFILRGSEYLKNDLPTLARAIGSYDGSSPPSVEHFLYWSKEKLGSKPVITMTHVLITAPHDGLTAIATKQIYASHYFNASLGITLIADASAPGGPPQTLLIYVSRSRLDVFDGLFGGLRRLIVRSRVRNSAAEVLRDLRERLERQFQQG